MYIQKCVCDHLRLYTLGADKKLYKSRIAVRRSVKNGISTYSLEIDHATDRYNTSAFLYFTFYQCIVNVDSKLVKPNDSLQALIPSNIQFRCIVIVFMLRSEKSGLQLTFIMETSSFYRIRERDISYINIVITRVC